MAEHDWGKEAIFDPPLVRQQIERIRIEVPPAVEAEPAPPLPDAVRAALENPQAVDRALERLDMPAARRPSDAETIASLALSISLLHSIHTQDMPGREHLPQPANPEEDHDRPGLK